MVCPECGLLPDPGRLAFSHRHRALMYVKRHNPDLASAASSHAYAYTEQHGHTYDDYVARLEAVVEAVRRLRLRVGESHDGALEVSYSAAAFPEIAVALANLGGAE